MWGDVMKDNMLDIMLDIPDSDPFKRDVFGREYIARNFMRIFNDELDGLVVSIDSDWGTGKTTFIKMWESMIKNDLEYKDQYETLYFNAWDNDYMDEPLVALLSEITLQTNKNTKLSTCLNKFKEKGSKLIKPIVSTGVKIATSGVVNLDNVNLGDDVEKYLPELSGKLAESILDDAVKAKEIRNTFKKEMEEYQSSSSKKVIFFIDELDRCRPTFAIKLLETIKHLFSMKNIIFVIALDKEQLSYSISTIYGEGMDTTGYLRRFFDLDYKLPNINREVYIDLKNQSNISKYANVEYFKEFLKVFIIHFKLSLRDIDKLYYYINILVPLVEEFRDHPKNNVKEIVLSYLYAIFAVLKIKKPIIYKNIMNGTYSYSSDAILSELNLDDVPDINFSISEEEILNIQIRDVLKDYLILNHKVIDGENISGSKLYVVGIEEIREGHICIKNNANAILSYNMRELFKKNNRLSLRLDFIKDF